MGKTATKPPLNDLYETDFFAWTQEQARLLRERRWDDLDLDNLTEEVEAVGRSDKRQIESRLEVLIAHLLKWKYQPGARSGGWRGTIGEQRRRIGQLVAESPSLEAYPASVFEQCYVAARMAAAQETGIDFSLLPAFPPFSLEQALDEGFLPTEPDLLDQE